MTEADTDTIYIKARNYVLYLLSRREYSESEIISKLKQKKFSTGLGLDLETINRLLIEIKNNNWQSDTRCAHMLLRHGVNSGYGPNKIKFQMQQKGLDKKIIENVFNCSDNSFFLDEQDNYDDYFWHKLAKKILIKKVGDNYNKNDFKTRAKLKQFLYNRGFELDHISYAANFNFNFNFDFDFEMIDA